MADALVDQLDSVASNTSVYTLVHAIIEVCCRRQRRDRENTDAEAAWQQITLRLIEAETLLRSRRL